MTEVVVVGVGSELRGDDGAGRDVVAAVAARAHPDVEVISTIQLTPELAPRIAGRHLIVVDAAVGAGGVTVTEVDVVGDPAAARLTHHLDAPRLVAAATALGWAPRRATVVSVPAVDLRFGTHRSPTTASAVPDAVVTVLALCQESVPATTG